MRKYYYHNQYNNDEFKPFCLLTLLGWRFFLGIVAFVFFISYINPLIESQQINTDPNSFLAPITNVIIQNAAESIFFLELSLFLWWIYIALLLIYYYRNFENIYSLSNQEIRSMGSLTPVWTDLLPVLLGALFPCFTH